MDGGRRSNLQPPFVSDYPPARDNLPPPLTNPLLIHERAERLLRGCVTNPLSLWERVRVRAFPRLFQTWTAAIRSARHRREAIVTHPLRYLAYRSGVIGHYLNLYRDRDNGDAPRNSYGELIIQPFPTNPALQEAMAWSESTTFDEVMYLLEYLSEKGWIREQYARSFSFQVTVDGHGRIADLQINPLSSQAFVAMWIDDDTEEAFTEGLRRGIEDAGYQALRIDKKEDVVKIDDEIISEIRRSRFLVADFTQGFDGARGGVYFEAGFALGLGIPVIFACRRDTVDKLHFDTRQYAHIVWDEPGDLRFAIRDRIRARLGQGLVGNSSAP